MSPALANAMASAMFWKKPRVVSVLDYTKGFGHADLVWCADAPA